MRRSISRWIAPVLAFAITSASAIADEAKLKKEELDQLVAPIALYSDELLANVLVASTYPLDVVQAARWTKDKANANLKGDALSKSLEGKDWDPSIKALVQFPDVLTMMSEQLDWTQKLGEAFLAQQSDVMDEIQFLRGKADAAGNLKDDKHQKVKKETTAGSSQPVYIIEPATPDTVYVPVYRPAEVYGPWLYPSYPPYYWPYPGASFVNGFFWGAGFAVANSIWGWNHWDWHRHDINVNVNKWNDINVNRGKISNGRWEHRADHRGPVPYRNKDVRDKFKPGDRKQIGDNEFRGRDTSAVKDRLKDSDHARVNDRANDAARDRPGAGGDASLRPGNTRERGAGRDKPRDTGDRANREARTTARGAAPKAFDVQRGSDVRRAADRGRASRTAMAPRPRAAPMRAGPMRGGGGRRGGGRRR